MQQRIVKVFKTFRPKEGDHYNFNIFPQGHFIKILSQGTRHFYAFDSKVSPKELKKSLRVSLCECIELFL